MKRIWILAVLLLFSGAAFSQSWLGLSLTGGYDYNFNKYYNYSEWTDAEHENMDFNTGLDIIMRMSKKVRFRIELRYEQLNYGQNSGSTSISKSEMKLHCIDINPRFDIRVWTKQKWELFLSPGLRLQYVVDPEETSYKSDGEISKHHTYVNTDYNDALPGVLAGAILKYNINKRLGLKFSPDFYYSFKKLYDEGNNNLMGFRSNIGIEYFF